MPDPYLDGGWYLWAGLIAAVVLAHAWGQWFQSWTAKRRKARRDQEIQRLMDSELQKMRSKSR